MKSTLYVDQVFKGGKVIRFLPSDRYGHRRVLFSCSSCRKRGQSRLSDLKRGTQASCGCRRDAQFLNWLREQASCLPAALRKEIWACGEIRGLQALYEGFGNTVAKGMGRRLRVSERRALLNYVWRTEGCRELASMPKKRREAFYVAIQRIGIKKVATVFGLPTELTLRIARSMCHRKVLSYETAVEAAHTAMMLLNEARKAGYKDSWWRPLGEFSKYELSAASRARKACFRAAYEALRLIPSGDLLRRDREVVTEFLEACERTIHGRKRRSDRFNAERDQRLRAELFPAFLAA